MNTGARLALWVLEKLVIFQGHSLLNLKTVPSLRGRLGVQLSDTVLPEHVHCKKALCAIAL